MSIFKKHAMWGVAFVVLAAGLTYITPYVKATSVSEKSKKYVVSVKSRYTIAAYSNEDTIYGTGVIVDIKKGLIVTNAHVAGRDTLVNEYEITMYDGHIVYAQLVYADALADIAFLKTKEPLISKNRNTLTGVSDIEFRKGMPEVGENITIIGKNENNHFSLQTGTIASLCESGPIGKQVYRISLNSQGGSSGSPVLDDNGRVVGVIFASNLVSSAFAVPAAYVRDAMNTLQGNKIPSSYTTGAVLAYSPIDDMKRYYHWPEEEVMKYRQNFPEAFSMITVVSEVLKGLPADGVLEPGDIVTHVNGSPIGPHIYAYDTLLNKHGHDKNVTITLWRAGKIMDVKVGTCDANERRIKQMLVFGGAVFYEADIFTILRTGGSEKLFISNIRPGSSFAEKLPTLPRSNTTLVALTHIDQTPIADLDTLRTQIASMMKKRDFTIRFINYGLSIGHNQTLFFAHCLNTQYITYVPSDGPSLWCVWDDATGQWKIEPIAPEAG